MTGSSRTRELLAKVGFRRKSNEAERRRLSERPILVGTALLTLLSALGIYLFGPEIGETGFVILSSLMTAGIVALFFERFYVRHHALLEEELVQDMKEMTAKKILQGIIAGGDRIWDSLNSTLIESDFYITRRSDVLVFRWGPSRKHIRLEIHRSTFVKNVRQKELFFPVLAIATSLEGNGDISRFTVSGSEIEFKNGKHDDPEGKIELTKQISPNGMMTRVEGHIRIPADQELGISYNVEVGNNAESHNYSYFVRQTESLFVTIFCPTDLAVQLWKGGVPSTPGTREKGVVADDRFHLSNISSAEVQETEYHRQDYAFAGILPTSGYLVEWEPEKTATNSS